MNEKLKHKRQRKCAKEGQDRMEHMVFAALAVKVGKSPMDDRDETTGVEESHPKMPSRTLFRRAGRSMSVSVTPSMSSLASVRLNLFLFISLMCCCCFCVFTLRHATITTSVWGDGRVVGSDVGGYGVNFTLANGPNGLVGWRNAVAHLPAVWGRRGVGERKKKEKKGRKEGKKERKKKIVNKAKITVRCV